MILQSRDTEVRTPNARSPTSAGASPRTAWSMCSSRASSECSDTSESSSSSSDSLQRQEVNCPLSLLFNFLLSLPLFTSLVYCSAAQIPKKYGRLSFPPLLFFSSLLVYFPFSSRGTLKLRQRGFEAQGTKASVQLAVMRKRHTRDEMLMFLLHTGLCVRSLWASRSLSFLETWRSLNIYLHLVGWLGFG